MPGASVEDKGRYYTIFYFSYQIQLTYVIIQSRELNKSIQFNWLPNLK